MDYINPKNNNTLLVVHSRPRSPSLTTQPPSLFSAHCNFTAPPLYLLDFVSCISHNKFPHTNPTAVLHHAHHLSSLSLPRQPEHITTPPSPIADCCLLLQRRRTQVADFVCGDLGDDVHQRRRISSSPKSKVQFHVG
uniref:Uncharacterized protein n=1 Tax=Helianthus annuus TaxID=4232 RepID=A0A251VPT5_HELAN